MFASLANEFTPIWIGWLAFFAIAEILAIYIGKRTHQDGGTLSEFIWRLLKANVIIFVVGLIFWTWLTFHFFVQLP